MQSDEAHNTMFTTGDQRYQRFPQVSQGVSVAHHSGHMINMVVPSGSQWFPGQAVVLVVGGEQPLELARKVCLGGRFFGIGSLEGPWASPCVR